MATRYSSGSGSGHHDSASGRSIRTITLIPVDAEETQRVFHSSIGTFTIGRSTTVGDSKADATSNARDLYTTSCPVVSRSHATIRWLPNGEVVIVDSDSHHGTYINDSLSRLTPSQAYKLQDQDTISFGKGIFKDGSFHPPHTVTIRMNAGEQTPPQKSRTGTYGLKSQRTEPRHMTPGEGSQSEVQASKIRTEVQRLKGRREVGVKQKRQLQDVSSRLEYLEKNALDKITSPQEVDLRLRALERHYEALLEKLTSIEYNLRVPAQADGSPERETSPRRRSSEDDGEDTDDDEPATPPAPRSSMAGTVAMVLVGGVAVWTALALS
ncbi:hypothetical protein M408DRAFT_22616 [Serendipita vermifera MAFF 305830]|uniref:FHA domain-containing protein n=1 Tax=Serendipita vermifera MAFF 305830 TaxID=933852 RepID=A0A0C3BE63_SERVB|nr:hypothetical protein M408DRAFT_22616 [Serendipita vermifera MAFF 305830]